MNKKSNIMEKVTGNSKHHLFNYFQVRYQLIKIFGKPKTKEDHEILHKRAKKCMDQMPVFIIDEKHHKEIHKKEMESRKLKLQEKKMLEQSKEDSKWKLNL